jgi:hypothetical protein
MPHICTRGPPGDRRKPHPAVSVLFSASTGACISPVTPLFRPGRAPSMVHARLESNRMIVKTTRNRSSDLPLAACAPQPRLAHRFAAIGAERKLAGSWAFLEPILRHDCERFHISRFVDPARLL